MKKTLSLLIIALLLSFTNYFMNEVYAFSNPWELYSGISTAFQGGTFVNIDTQKYNYKIIANSNAGWCHSTSLGGTGYWIIPYLNLDPTYENKEVILNLSPGPSGSRYFERADQIGAATMTLWRQLKNTSPLINIIKPSSNDVFNSMGISL